MEQFIQNILIGVRQWVNGKLEDITYVISSHINELTGRVSTLEQAGGQPNVIETVKVDGTVLTVTDKAVDIDLATPLSGKVDKVAGKGLSTEDYTTAEKTKLSGIAEGAQANVIESISVNGNAATISGKAASVTIGEATTSTSGVMSAADKSKLDGVESGAQENVLESISAADNSVTVGAVDASKNQTVAVKLSADADNAITLESDGLKVVVPAATVTGVKSGDKVLALDGTELTSTISLSHDSENHLIKLIGKNSEEISSFSTDDFIKDGMLDYAGLHVRTTAGDPAVTTWSPALPETITVPASVTTDGTYLVLEWNTGASKTPTFINVTSLIDTYTAGTGLTLTDHQFSLNAANASTIGGVKPGDGMAVDANGVITVSYATSSVAGAVKVGTGLSIDNNGVLSADPQSYASTSTYGVVKIGDNISVADGVISVDYTSYSTYGVVRVGSGLAVADGVISILTPTVEQVLAVLNAHETPAAGE